MAIVSNLGFPRIGARRELKKALESYWSGKSSEADLLVVGKTLRNEHWTLPKQFGIEHIPSDDVSLYDHVLDTAAMVGAVPSRYGWSGGIVDQFTYFAMARGSKKKGLNSSIAHVKADVPALEMTKWFGTNYHYIVPDFELEQTFQLASLKPVDDFSEAKAAGIGIRPVLLGPTSFLLLGKSKNPRLQRLSLLDGILAVYEDVLRRLERAGAEWVQIDEPCLVLDLTTETRNAFASAYDRLTDQSQLRL